MLHGRRAGNNQVLASERSRLASHPYVTAICSITFSCFAAGLLSCPFAAMNYRWSGYRSNATVDKASALRHRAVERQRGAAGPLCAICMDRQSPVGVGLRKDIYVRAA